MAWGKGRWKSLLQGLLKQYVFNFYFFFKKMKNKVNYKRRLNGLKFIESAGYCLM